MTVEPSTLPDVASRPVVAPTGAQYSLRGDTEFGRATVTITEVAAALRSFEVNGLDIVQRYPVDASPSLGAGMIMAPWPNRIDSGRWTYQGHVEQLDLTEPKFTNALHGLLAHAPYTVEDRTEASITLTATIFSHPGYPFVVETKVNYQIDQDGLTVRHTLTNIGSAVAPVAIGTHGYFKIGDVDTADLLLSNSSATVYTNDARLLPTGTQPVHGQFDLRDGRRVGGLILDDCFTDQTPTRGRFRSRLSAEDGRYVEVWTDENFSHVVLLTTRQFIDETGHATLAVAIEPQTAAANCLNNQIGLRWLEAGESWWPTWGVRADLHQAHEG